MARRKNVKRIDPRYFLHETVNRGEELEECGEMGPEGPMDTSQLSPEEAFTAGMSAARDAIDQALGDPDGPWLPEEGDLSGNGPMGEPAMHETVNRGETLEQWCARKTKNQAEFQDCVSNPAPYRMQETANRELEEGVGDDIAAIIEYAVEKGLRRETSADKAAQIFADIQGEGSYAEEDVEAAYENWERYDLGGVGPDAMEL